MKKVLILLIMICLLTACGYEKQEGIVDEEDFVLEKIDDEKGYVYLENFKVLRYGRDKIYEIKNLVINVRSNDVDNVNLEMKNFVLNSYNNANIVDGYMKYGNIIDYEYYEIDDFISVIQKYYFYMDNMEAEVNSNIYVIKKDSGKVLSNRDILDCFDYSEERLYTYLGENVVSDDVEFTLMQIKENGYKLYVNDDRRMVVVYSEILNDGMERKELVI